MVDATFRREKQRESFVLSAKKLGVKALFLHCTATASETQTRLKDRTHDVSDADWLVYKSLSEEWEDFGTVARGCLYEISTSGELANALEQALQALKTEDLA